MLFLYHGCRILAVTLRKDDSITDPLVSLNVSHQTLVSRQNISNLSHNHVGALWLNASQFNRLLERESERTRHIEHTFDMHHHSVVMRIYIVALGYTEVWQGWVGSSALEKTPVGMRWTWSARICKSG
jgi:hypothetical protein